MRVTYKIIVTQKDDVVIQSRSFAVQIPSNRSGTIDAAERAAERLVSRVGAAAALGKLCYVSLFKDNPKKGQPNMITTSPFIYTLSNLSSTIIYNIHTFLLVKSFIIFSDCLEGFILLF